MTGQILALAAGAAMSAANNGACNVGTAHTTETARAGAVVAVLSFDTSLHSTQRPCDEARGMHLRIMRAHRVVYDGDPSIVAHQRVATGEFDVRQPSHHSDPVVTLGYSIGRQDYVIDYTADSSNPTYSPHVRVSDWREPSYDQNAVRIKGSAGFLSFVMDYTRKDFRVIGTPRISIDRAGRRVYDGPLISKDTRIFANVDPIVRDIDGDGEPELVLDLSELGTNCCALSEVFWYSRTSGAFRRSYHEWGLYRDMPTMMSERDSNRTLFITRNEDLSGRFAGGCCSAPAPIRIDTIIRGGFVDVTRQYPRMIRDDAWGFWWALRQAPRHLRGDMQRVFLVDYLADKQMLGEGDDGWRQAKSIYEGNDWPAFAAEARQALTAEDYLAKKGE
jgi:hypothetical protein